MGSTIDVVVPSVGESVSEGNIGKWFYKDGDVVKKDSPLFELESDKATMEVTAADSGRLKILVAAGQTVPIGSTVGKIEADGSAGASKKQNGKKAEAKVNPELKKAETPAPSHPDAGTAASANPRTESPIKESKPMETTHSDDKIKQFSPSQRKAIRHGQMPTSKTNPATGVAETREPMTALRKTIAQRLVYSQQSTATLTTFNEVDMTNAMKVRSDLKDEFAKKYGVKLGFMSFFSAAVISALKKYPIMNSHIDGSDVVHMSGYHLGIAVSTERGLVVPVVRDADHLSFADLEKRIGELAEKARSGKLSIPEMQGGTFTITNGGVFGSLLSTPILNPPQSGILGMHKTEHRPIAVEQKDGSYKVEVRPMMYVALSYDHRIIDGATSVGFLVAIKEYLETVTRNQVLSS